MLLAVKPVIIGLTVVAFATSAPELLVSLVASAEGSGGISMGNILGSNVINIALVLGTSAMIKPVGINPQLVRFDLPYMIGSCLVLWLLCMDTVVGFGDGIILITILVVFLSIGIYKAKDFNMTGSRPPASLKRYTINAALMIGGLIALAKGAAMVVDSAIVMARTIGLSETFIGVSIVAFGTSLPELATSSVAASKGESDISIGNVIGSNIFNACMVMGLVGLLSPMTIESDILWFDFPFMIGLSIVLYVLSRLSDRIGRASGAGFCLLFVIYLSISYSL